MLSTFKSYKYNNLIILFMQKKLIKLIYKLKKVILMKEFILSRAF